MKLQLVVSGGQTGADIAALSAARAVGIQTGGFMPKGWITEDGPRPDYARLYGLKESQYSGYQMRTEENVALAEATLRIAANLNSPGEHTTLRAIKKLGKPHRDVHVMDPKIRRAPRDQSPEKIARWLHECEIESLNVAGNRESKAPGIEQWANYYLVAVFDILRRM